MTGHEVAVVLPGTVDDPAAPSGGNTYDRELCRGLPAAGWSVRRLPVAGDWPHPDRAARRALAAALAGLPDRTVVLLDGLVACAAPEQVVPEAARLAPVVLVHLPLADETGLAAADAAELSDRERRTLRAVPAVVATSDWAARRLASRHGLAPGRVHVAVPGVAPAPLSPGTRAGARLLCVAALTPRKGQDGLVEALAGVADWWFHCTLVGDLTRAPGFASAVRGLVAEHGLTDRVTFAGPRTGAALADAYAGADLVVLPSRAETYGMVVTEALARGIPVVAADTGGVPQALGRAPDGQLPGMLVPPEEPARLAAALRRWLADPATRDRLRAAARARRAALPGWAPTVATVAGVLASVAAPAAGAAAR